MALPKLLGPQEPSGLPDLLQNKKQEHSSAIRNCHVCWPVTMPRHIPSPKEKYLQKRIKRQSDVPKSLKASRVASCREGAKGREHH